MARAQRARTRHQGVYHRDVPAWRVYDITYRIGGRKVWESGFTTQAAAQERLAEQRLNAQHGAPAPVKKLTLREFIDEVWLARQQARVAQGVLRESTLAQCRRDVRLHIEPAFGARRLDRIDLAAIQAFHDRLFDHQSSWSVRRIINTLSGILELARKHGHIRHNPVRDIEKAPARAKRDPVILTVKQVNALIDATPDPATGALLTVAAFTGMRQSEIFGLRWKNVDLTEEAEAITVAEQHYRGQTVTRAKTAAGMRVIPIAPRVASALREHYLRQQVESRPNREGLVFPGKRGGYMHASNFTRGAWKKARSSAGLDDLDFHELRRFYVSHLRMQNLPASVSRQLVGHSDEKTHDGYTHPVPGTETQIRQALARAFAPAEDAHKADGA